MADSAWNTERIVRLAALAVLVIACGQVILPFVGALTWAGIIAVTIWPAFVWLAARLGNRPVLAATICTLVLVLVLVLPFAAKAASLGQAVPQVAELIQELAGRRVPPPPDWLVTVPAIGPLLEETWTAAATDVGGVIQRLAPGAERAGVWALGQGAGIALAVLEFLFAILISGVFLLTADRSIDLVQRIVSRLKIGESGVILDVVVGTVRSVSIGLVGTASIQALIASLGFFVAGMPGTPLLGFMTFLFALVQLPTAIVWGPAALWLWLQDETTRAIGLAIYGFALVNTVDNFLRPWLISRGAHLPFALIFMGVIGGLLAWGMIGLFIGPTILAVAYSLVRTWVGLSQARQAPQPPPGSAG